MADEKKPSTLKTFVASAMIASQLKKQNEVKGENGEIIKVGGIVKYKERKRVEIIADTKHYKVGQIINPHKIMGEALIEQGIAKEAVKK
jgi:hypothetical protein